MILRRMLHVAPALPVLAALAGGAGGGLFSGEPSRLIFPPPGTQLRFSHRTHADEGCATCHAGARRSVSAADRNLPPEAICGDCHDQVRERQGQSSGPAKRCRHCHVGYDGKGAPERLVYPTARLRFSHRLHGDKGETCVSCHAVVAPGGGRPFPRMTDCRGCHARRGASLRCVACHLSNKDGRVRTRFGAARLRPSGVLKGDAHTPSFAREHRAVARGNRRYCQRCHQPRSCQRCHSGSLRPMSIHGNDYVTRHALDARRKTTRCRSCHRSQTFCLGCHQRSGVGAETPGSGFRPSTGKRFHPAGFSALRRGPGHHAYAARRNMRSCSSCHRESTCVRCHGTRRRGFGGMSPHPPGFARSAACRAMASRNQRACIKCHGASDRRIQCL